jgi:hypothetical protein
VPTPTAAAIGLKSHSGWAAAVVLAVSDGHLRVLDRCRMETLGTRGTKWAGHPYHAAQELAADEDAEAFIARERALAQTCATVELRLVLQRVASADHEVVACGLLAGDAMPAWSLPEILAVHIRMHRAEGALYREAIESAAAECGLPLVRIPEKRLTEVSSDMLGQSHPEIARAIGVLGKQAGPPWGKDQKVSALAAWIALQNK